MICATCHSSVVVMLVFGRSLLEFTRITVFASLFASFRITLSSGRLLESSLSFRLERSVRHHSLVRIDGTGKSSDRRADERRHSSLSLSLNFRYLGLKYTDTFCTWNVEQKRLLLFEFRLKENQILVQITNLMHSPLLVEDE